jgi:hypothetical protein
MVVVRLCGGLGNQLFQYAAGRRLAHARSTELVLDLGWYNRTPSSDTPRVYELGNYPIQARLTTFGEAVWCLLHGGSRVDWLSFLPQHWSYFREIDFEFDSSVLSLPNNTYIDGYWQSPSYFEDIANLLRVELNPSTPFGLQDTKIATLISGGGAVAVHVRRGDYVNSSHGLCPEDYYKHAIDRVMSKVTSPHFFVFSDDISWTRENISLPEPTTFVDHNGTFNAVQDLRLISMCDHCITANSTFSWWGAWLNPHPDKIVVAPKQWFADNRNTDTLIPTDWIRVD